MSHEQPTTGRAVSLADRVAMNIRAELAARRLGSGDLAACLGIGSRAAIRRLNGEIDFPLNEVEQVAAWLGVSIAALLAPRPTGQVVAA